MLMEYLAEATVIERRAELERCALAEAALALHPRRRSWLARLVPGWSQPRASRSRSAASAAGHSLSMME